MGYMNGGPIQISDIRATEPGARWPDHWPESWPDPATLPRQEPAPTVTDPFFSDDAPDRPAHGGARPVLGWVAVALAALWVAALLWLARGTLSSMTPLALAQFGAALATVPALAGVIWLGVLRTSTAEAQRFGATARAMRGEAVALENTVAVLGATIEEQRTQMAEQVRLLTALGDAATARLADIAGTLSAEVQRVDAQTGALTTTAGTAHARLDALIAALPRAADETRALTETIDQAGLVAYEHSAGLDAQVAALVARGRDAEAIAGGAAEKLAAYMQRMETTSHTAGARHGLTRSGWC
jgi:hypothetical protein